MKKSPVALPFSLSRNAKLTLSEQLADGIRRAIDSGFYRPGDVLPTLHELAAALNVSLRIPREAMAKLTAEGFVNPRQSVGAVVLDRGSKVWRGNVLLLMNGYDFASYGEARFAAEFRNRLYQGRCLCSHFAFPADESVKRFDYSALEVVLRQPTDLCVVRWGDARLYRLLEEFEIPFVAIAKRRQRYSHCRGVIQTEGVRLAAKDLAAACLSAGVRHVEVFDYAEHGDNAVQKAMKAHGIGVKTHVFARLEGCERLEAITYGALQGMRGYLAQRRRSLPDLMYFADDFFAAGALTALQEAGVDVPCETRVVTLANRGNRPVWTKGLARLEVDMSANGRLCAEYALAIIDGVTDPPLVAPVARFVPDETFPVDL